MFISKLATLYGVVLIAATDAFPGMIPNQARQDPSTSDTQPIQLSSVSGGATSFLLTHTVPPPVPSDPSTPTAPVRSLSASTTINQSKMADASPAVSIATPDTPTVTHGATGMTQTLEPVTESPTRVVSLPSGGLA